jgi:hypothetical protein
MEMVGSYVIIYIKDHLCITFQAQNESVLGLFTYMLKTSTCFYILIFPIISVYL